VKTSSLFCPFYLLIRYLFGSILRAKTLHNKLLVLQSSKIKWLIWIKMTQCDESVEKSPQEFERKQQSVQSEP